MTQLAQLHDAVFIHDQQVRTDSLKVADIFGKQHKDILRKLESLDCSPDFSERNFALAEYLDGQGKPRPMYEMSKDGFIFLVMGFTGAAAARIKEAYINTFNQMAAMLHNQQYTKQGIQSGAKVQLITGSPEFTVNQMHYDKQGYLESVEAICWHGNRLHKATLNVASVIAVQGFYNPVLESFWKIIYAVGLDKLNHSKVPNLVALNLKQIVETIQGIPSRLELTNLLMQSRSPYPKLVRHNYPMKSAITHKTMRCWVFDTSNATQTIEYKA